MGEGLLRARAQDFKHQQDYAHQQELATGNLFSNAPDILTKSFNCIAKAPVADLLGEVVILIPKSDVVEVVLGNRTIGQVLPEETSALAESIQEDPHCPGFCTAIVEDASEIASDFVIRITDHTEGKK